MAEDAAATNTPASASHDIDIMRYASFRRREIDLLSSESFLTKQNKNKSLFQLLPRHMRRRTMGYIRKRLPHRIRSAAVIKPPSKIGKRPSRKFRRKPVNLVAEYERRKRASEGKMWLETHIWHAKRFHMSESLFGYKLALHDNCKSKRAVYRGLKSNCLIHDESYHVCHELIGPQEDLIASLSRLCSAELGLTFAAKMHIKGQFEGKIVLYEADKFPFGCIGPCRFMWRPELDSSSSNSIRTLWIWSHPSIYLDIQKQLIEVFSMNAAEEEVARKDDNDEDDNSPKVKKIKLDSVETQATSGASNNKFKSAKNISITLACLKDEFVRFKLIGPYSTTILANVLKTVDNQNAENTSESNLYEKQSRLWNDLKLSIKDPNQVMTSTILGLIVKDPRLALPKKKAFNEVKKQNESSNGCKKSNQTLINQEMRAQILSHSPIWEKRVIDELNENKKSTHEINKLRQEYLMPSTRLTQLENHSQIPVLLVQNTLVSSVVSIQNGTLHSGWDFIAPKSWAMAFWMCFVHFGARAIGQNELSYLLFESGNLQFPHEYIDTNPCLAESNKLKLDLYQRHLRRPPSKRVNFLKQNFLSPFYPPIKSIITLNNQFTPITNQNYFVLRNRSILLKIERAFFHKKSNRKDDTKDNLLSTAELEIVRNSYTGVRVECEGRGQLAKFSLIFDYDEKRGKEENEEERNNGKLAMARLLSDYRRDFINKLPKIDNKGKKANMNKLIRTKFNANACLVDEEQFLKYYADLADSTSYRPPIGFVVNGGFNLASGKCAANAFILTKSILERLGNKGTNHLISFKTPTTCSSNLIHQRTAKITHFLI